MAREYRISLTTDEVWLLEKAAKMYVDSVIDKALVTITNQHDPLHAEYIRLKNTGCEVIRRLDRNLDSPKYQATDHPQMRRR